jgi:hypothetical protein
MECQDETFKQLAFVSRNRMKSWSRFEETYENFPEYAVISGPMLQAHNLSFEKMVSWGDITEEHLLRNINEPNDVARQHSWREGLSKFDFEDAVEEKIVLPVARSLSM